MDRESMEKGLINKHNIKNNKKINGEDDIMGSSVTPLLLYSTFVAISASFTFGCATGYSSAAQAGIVADLGLSTAQLHTILTFCAVSVTRLVIFLTTPNYWALIFITFLILGGVSTYSSILYYESEVFQLIRKRSPSKK